MRRAILIPLILLALSPQLLAQAAKPANGKQVDSLLPHQKAFSNLPLETRKAFITHHREASRLFSEKRIIECLEALKMVEKAFADSPELWNLRGSCYVELRAFDKALYSFRKAAEITDANYSIQFNIAEVHFVSHEWQTAHDVFVDLLKRLPEGRKDLARISEFKVMLCKFKLGKEAEARELANKYDYLDDSPYHYFSKAVLAYEEGDSAAAERWIARAARIFRNATVLAPWHDTLVEYGYIKSFYGGEGQ